MTAADRLSYPASPVWRNPEAAIINATGSVFVAAFAAVVVFPPPILTLEDAGVVDAFGIRTRTIALQPLHLGDERIEVGTMLDQRTGSNFLRVPIRLDETAPNDSTHGNPTAAMMLVRYVNRTRPPATHVVADLTPNRSQ